MVAAIFHSRITRCLAAFTPRSTCDPIYGILLLTTTNGGRKGTEGFPEVKNRKAAVVGAGFLREKWCLEVSKLQDED